MGNPVRFVDPDGRAGGDPNSGGTPAVDDDNKKTTAQSSTAVNTPKKFETVKRTTNTKAPEKTAGGNIKADCKVTAKQTTHVTQNSLVNVDVSSTEEIQKGKNNVEVIQNINTGEQEAEVTTNYGVKVNMPTKCGPVLSGLGSTSMGVDGNSVIIDFSMKITGTPFGFGLTISVNTTGLSAVAAPVINAVGSRAEPLIQASEELIYEIP
jgi:hypothetical protein